jgi:cystathionine beta-lyase/cystathionine gamma-synthase
VSNPFDLRTHVVHAGLAPDPVTGALVAPLYQTTTYRQDAVGQDRGYTYTRSGNPTVAALEAHLGALEEAPPAVAFATGMAAITGLLLATARAGDHVVCGRVVYGGTVRLLRQVLAPLGVEADFADTRTAAAVAAAIRPRTKLVLIETPANPTLELADIAGIAAACRAAGVPLAVDNTFLTPALQRPLDLGADVSVYSTTKYLEGHNTTVGGAVVTRDAALIERLRFVCNAVGFPQSPFEAWLTIRGTKTLVARMEAHCRHATAVATWLERHPAVARVHFPGLETFPQKELAARQQRGPGGIVAFELHGGLDAGVRLMNGVRLCALAENLGAVETLITHPASMTHAPIPPDEREAIGITDGLVRLSVGLEDPADVIADLEQALNA